MNLVTNVFVCTIHTTQPETENLERIQGELAKDNKQVIYEENLSCQ